MDIKPITTNILRSSYESRKFSFGNPEGQSTVVLVGSCRVVPFLNNLRIYNAMYGKPFQLICLNPVEMWDGPGNEVSDCADKVMEGFKFGKVDFLICEHIERCGVLNTVRSAEKNVFDSLGCDPITEIRLPNWNDMHIFDAETAMHDPVGYTNLPHPERVEFIREQTGIHKTRFLSHCRQSSFPELGPWVEERWLNTRLGWTSSHPSHALVWKMFEGIAYKMGLVIVPAYAHLCSHDVYKSTGISLTPVDYEANEWKF